MPRIEGVSDQRAGFFARIAYFFTRRKVGRVVGPVRVSAHNPPILAAYGAFEMLSERATRVDASLKSLASLRTATLIGCPF